MCAKCKKLYDTVLLYEAHLDCCEGAELSDADADPANDDNEAEKSTDNQVDDELEPTYEHLSTVIGGDAADLMNAVIKTEEELMLILDDEDELLMHNVEYLDE